MTYEYLKHLKPSDFKRRCGVHPETFDQIVEVLRPELDRRGKRGGQAKLSVENQLLVVLFVLARIPDAISHWQQLGLERVGSVSIDSAGRICADGIGQVPLTG